MRDDIFLLRISVNKWYDRSALNSKKKAEKMTQNGVEIDMESIENLSEEQKKAFLHVFCKMASVDGQFDDCEKIFIGILKFFYCIICNYKRNMCTAFI